MMKKKVGVKKGRKLTSSQIKELWEKGIKFHVEQLPLRSEFLNV
jgi:hypothetical protein